LATDAEVDMQRAIVASVCVRAFTRLAAVPKIRRRRHVDARPRVCFFLGVDPEVFVTISRVHLGSLPVKGVWEAVTNRISIVPSPSAAMTSGEKETAAKSDCKRVGSQRTSQSRSLGDRRDGGVITMSKREKYFEALRKQKLDTVRWSIGAGGQSPGLRDDDGYTAIMICAQGNLHKALRMLCDFVRRAREKELMDLTDGDGEGRTALMMAAHNGHVEACQELLDAGCNYRAKCRKGKTAADYARGNGHDELAARIDRGGESEEEDTDDDDDVDPDAPEGETATQRSKRKKKELEALERRGGDSGDKKQQEATRKKAEREAERLEAEANRPTPCWPEVEKAIAGDLKELALEDDGGDLALAAVPTGEEVDPATWWAISVNNLKISMRAKLTVLPAAVARLSGLRTLILSDNSLTSLPGEIGELSQLRVLEAERNQIASIPDEIANCKNLENVRVGYNKITDLSALADCDNLVTLVVDGNALDSLESLNLQKKQRLVTLSAKKNGIESVPADLGKCQLLAEIFLNDNKIGDLPMSMGELKEKKVRAIELDGNPLNDPKVKKMMGKSANLVKELLVYVRKNGVKEGGGGKGGKGGKGKKGKKAKAESSDDEPEPDPEPAKAPQPPAEPANPAKPADDDDDDGSDSEDEEEMRDRIRALPKKERAKAERKMLEKLAAKAAKKAAKKRAEAEAVAATQRAHAVDHRTLDDTPSDESEIDSDDEEAILARRNRQKAKEAGGGAYTLTPEQRRAAEKAEADRVAAIRAAKEAEEAEARRKLEEKEAEEKFAAMRLKEKESGQPITWVFEKGSIVRGHGGIPWKPGKKPGEQQMQVAFPQMLVGRIIGKGGATIREMEARSRAKVSVAEGKGGPGMATLVVVGDERAGESVRMMANNALGGGKR